MIAGRRLPKQAWQSNRFAGLVLFSSQMFKIPAQFIALLKFRAVKSVLAEKTR